MNRLAKKRTPQTVNVGAWLNTYADMVTLILTFFILLYSMSTINAQKYAQVAEALANKRNIIEAPEGYIPGGTFPDGGYDSENDSSSADSDTEDQESFDILYKILMNYVNENNLQGDVSVEKTDEAVFIRFRNNIFFDGYSSELKQSGKGVLDALVLGIKEADPVIQEVIISGHTAMVESDPTNIDRSLSSDRANAVLMYFESKNIIDPQKLVGVGYGLHRPIASNDTAEGRAQNRRVEIYISRKGHEKSLTEHIYDILSDRENSKDDSTE